MSAQNWYSLGKMFGVLGLAVVLFAAGRYTATPETKVISVDKIKEIHTETVSSKSSLDIEAIKKMFEDYSKSSNKTRVVIVRPDGTRIEKETSQTDVTKKTVTDQTTKVAEKKEEVKTIYIEKIEEHTKIVEVARKEKWGLILQGGYAWQDSKNYLPIPDKLILGLGAEHKFIGPVFLGALVNSRLDTLLQLSVRF